jgi:hypothetical protein
LCPYFFRQRIDNDYAGALRTRCRYVGGKSKDTTGMCFPKTEGSKFGCQLKGGEFNCTGTSWEQYDVSVWDHCRNATNAYACTNQKGDDLYCQWVMVKDQSFNPRQEEKEEEKEEQEEEQQDEEQNVILSNNNPLLLKTPLKYKHSSNSSMESTSLWWKNLNYVYISMVF